MRLLGSGDAAESSATIRTRVEAARGRQRLRYGAASRASCNAQTNGRSLLATLDSDARQLVDAAAESLSLSARAYHRVIKVARTIADLASDDRITTAHVGEALRYRSH